MEAIKKIRVLVVDDSTLMREALKDILNSDPEIEVVGFASDGLEGVNKAVMLKPDVITMDLKMPVMGGLDAIEKIMQESPIPIIVVSSMDVKIIVKALGIGAMDFVAVAQDIEGISRELVEKIKIASKIKPLKRINIKPVIPLKSFNKKEVKKIVAIGVSTGGPQALRVILAKIPPDFPAGILIVQHMSKGFIQGLVDWLKMTSSLGVELASAGKILKNPTALIAPDDYNLKINPDFSIFLSEDTNKNTFHVPNIDAMMKSVAQSFGKNSVGVILTGMGSDGVEGIKEIKRAGGVTIAQDEKSSIIFGMNKVAIDSGCIDKVVSLDKIAEEIIKAVYND